MKRDRDRMQKGTVTRVGDNWCVRYADWRIENGERIRKQGLTHKLGAVLNEHARLKRPPKYITKLQAEFMGTVNEGRAVLETGSTIDQFVQATYLPFVQTHRAFSTASGAKYYWRTLLKPYIGRHQLRDFTTADAERALNQIARDHPSMAKTTLHKLRSFLSGIFKRSIGQGIRNGSNPIREVTLPKGQPSQPTYAYDLGEIRQLLGLIEDEVTRCIISLAGYAGLSRSEIQGLCWESYDAENGEIKVMSSVVRGHRGEPKTQARKNSVPLIPSVRALLDMYRARCGDPVEGVMFPTGNGTPVDLHNLFSDRIDPVLNVCDVCDKPRIAHVRGKRINRGPKRHEYKRREGIEWHGWHALRRGLASNLNELGAPDLVIQRILRHSNVATTRAAYIKVRDPQVQTAMAQLGDEIRRLETVESEAKLQKARVQ